MAPFCSCPASLVSRIFFAVGRGCAKCDFFVALRWAPRPFGGARAKKKTPGCFFLLRPRGKAGEGEAPCRHGARAKKKTPPRVFFFLLRPRGKAREGEAPLGAGTGPEQKKNTTQGVFFFLLQPRGKAGEGEAPLGAGTVVCFFCSGPVPAPNGASPSPAFPRGRSKKKKHLDGVFFLLWPRAGAQRGFSFPFLSPGPQQKKNSLGCFFFALAPCRHGASPSPAFPRGRSKKKKKPGWCFFFAAAPRGRSLTHCGPGWRCLPLAGVVFVFLLRGGAGPGWCFFFCCGPARTLTHSLWAGAISARPGWCFFFLLRPRRVFLDNNKKCLGYYIGSKKTRRGHSKKKSTTSKVFFFALAPCRRPTGLLLPLPFPGPEQKKKHTLGGVFFWLWPRAGFKRGFSFPCLSPGPQQKKNTLGGVFFLLWPRAGAQRGFSFPCLSPGPEQKKKNTLCGVVFLRRPRADAHSLTAGLGGDASPSAGWCFFFCCGPARTGVVFFFLLWPRPDAHSLTVGWGDFGKARVVFFFLLRPRRVFLDNNKKCLGYYIGSKKTRRGHSKKKKHHFHPGP